MTRRVVLASALLVVDADCAARVFARAAQLPLRRDATLTILDARMRRVARVAEIAHDVGAELVVVGHPGWWSMRLVSLMGRVPVLLARSRVDRYRRALVAFASRDACPETLLMARELAPGAAMASVHVDSGDGERARRRVASALDAAGPSGAGWTRHFEHGEVREVIVRTAAESCADVVVLASRRRSPLSRLVLGSVGRDVARSVPCDVLIVPASRGGVGPVLEVGAR